MSSNRSANIRNEQEIQLAGGNENVIVQIGDTVRRPQHPWTPAVQALLHHLAEVGFAGAPRALGMDVRGREVQSFIPGRVGNHPLAPEMTTDGALRSAAKLLRAYHEAAIIQPGWETLPWHWRHPERQRWEVICHGDVAPYNTVFDGSQARALIDFDHAGPGPRLWDIAYAAYRFVPLAADSNLEGFGFGAEIDRFARLQAFLEAYGECDCAGMISLVIVRVEILRDDILSRAAAGDPSIARHLEEDHVGSYNADLEWLRAHQAKLEALVSWLD